MGIRMHHEPSFFTALTGLIFVLGIIFLISWLFKRFGAGLISGVAAVKKKNEVELLEIRPVDPKNRLVLARCKGREYLLLTGETNTMVDSFAANGDNSANIEPNEKDALIDA